MTDRPTFPETTKRIAELREEIDRLFRENPKCPTCYDTGYTPGPPCGDCELGRLTRRNPFQGGR